MTGRPPVILLGMHRSGTTLLAQALRDCGLFVGYRLDAHCEAVFFRRLNDWALQRAGASWDRPSAFRELSARQRCRMASTLGDRLRGMGCLSYLGPGRWLRERGLDTLAMPWGWKDPRNTFTISLWLKLFGNARLVRIHRHPVDVAASLVVRQRSTGRRRTEDELFGDSRAPAGVRRDLEQGFQLWRCYEEQADLVAANVGHQMLTVRFEEVTTDALDALGRVAEFAGLRPRKGVLEEVASSVDGSRALAYRRSPLLSSFYETTRGVEIVRRLGY